MTSFLYLMALTAGTAAALIVLGRRDAPTRGQGLRSLDVRGLALAGAMIAAGLAMASGESKSLLGGKVLAASGETEAWTFSGDQGPDPNDWVPPGESEAWKPYRKER